MAELRGLALGGVEGGDDVVDLVPGRRTRSRNCGASRLVNSSENLRRISPCHCSISEGGTRIKAERIRPRRRSSARIRPASMVLPRPTSSHSRALPRKRCEDRPGRADLVVQQFHMSRTSGRQINWSKPALVLRRGGPSGRGRTTAARQLACAAEPQQGLVLRVERKLNPRLGVHFRREVGGRFGLREQLKPTGLLVLEPQRHGARRGGSQRTGQLQR